MADVYGTNGPDNRSGTNSGEYLYGYGGDDTLDGKGGGDILFGHDGNDRLYGGGGTDWFYGGNGSDALYGGDHNDVFWAALEGAGDDTFHGDGGYDTVDYSGAATGVVIALHLDKAGNTALGNDKLHWVENAAGGEYSDIIHGTDWSFLGIAGWGENTLYGRGGSDNIYGRSGDDKLYGGTGFDVLNGGDGADQLYGGDDADFLYGNNDNDKLYGGGGDDRLNGGLGDDHLDGGAGYDTVSFADATNAMDMIFDTQGKDTFANIEAMIGSSYDDWFVADELPRMPATPWTAARGTTTCTAPMRKDALIGGDGNDELEGRGLSTSSSAGRGRTASLSGKRGFPRHGGRPSEPRRDRRFPARRGHHGDLHGPREARCPAAAARDLHRAGRVHPRAAGPLRLRGRRHDRPGQHGHRRRGRVRDRALRHRDADAERLPFLAPHRHHGDRNRSLPP